MERGVSRLVINYKPLNKALQWIRYHIPNKKDLLDRLWLEKNPPTWTKKHSMIIKQIKKYVKQLPCIVISSPNTFKIVETDNSDIGYGGILKQVAKNDTKEQIIRFYSGFWSAIQQNHSTIKKEILSTILCVSKFHNDLFN